MVGWLVPTGVLIALIHCVVSADLVQLLRRPSSASSPVGVQPDTVALLMTAYNNHNRPTEALQVFRSFESEVQPDAVLLCCLITSTRGPGTFLCWRRGGGQSEKKRGAAQVGDP